MKIYYIDDLVKELNENRFADDLEVLIDGSPIEKIKLGHNCLNIIPTYSIENYEDEIEDLKSEIKSLENQVDSLLVESYDDSDAIVQYESVLADIKNAFDDGELKHKIKEYFEMHENGLNVMNDSELIDFIKTVTNWYNIEEGL